MERKACRETEGAWSSEEEEILRNYVQDHGEGNWKKKLPKRAGLSPCGESCKHRWLNHLKPDIYKGTFSLDEEELIIRLHKLLGNRWSIIAGRLPGRTKNEIENFWYTHLRKKEEKHNKSEFISTSVTSTTKIRDFQYLKCDENSFSIDPIKSPHHVIKPKAVRLTKVVKPTQNGWNSHNPSTSTL